MTQMMARAACFIHRGYFWFDPDHVVVVYVDPLTAMPVDVDLQSERMKGQLYVKEPICDDCVRTVNAERIIQGLEPIETAALRAARMGLTNSDSSS